jgi:hypothetical protein
LDGKALTGVYFVKIVQFLPMRILMGVYGTLQMAM